MKLAVKTLKGEKFEVNVDANLSVSEVKGIIVRLYIVFPRISAFR